MRKWGLIEGGLSL